jgi:hypothetical protein
MELGGHRLTFSDKSSSGTAGYNSLKEEAETLEDEVNKLPPTRLKMPRHQKQRHEKE